MVSKKKKKWPTRAFFSFFLGCTGKPHFPLHSTVLCRTKKHSTEQDSIVQYNTAQYNTVLFSSAVPLLEGFPPGRTPLGPCRCPLPLLDLRCSPGYFLLLPFGRCPCNLSRLSLDRRLAYRLGSAVHLPRQLPFLRPSAVQSPQLPFLRP